MRRHVSLVLCLMLMNARTAVADFRCPTSGKIVEIGMSQYEVESKCGAPSAKNIIANAQNQASNSNVGVQQIEEWTYDFGSSRLIRKLRFEGGVLKEETAGSYGVKAQNPGR